MPPDPMPSIGLAMHRPAGAIYEATTTGTASDCRAECLGPLRHRPGYSNAHIQGRPAALRELAAALIDARRPDRADLPRPAAAVVEGVAG